jgi:hypothetical protein
MLWCVLGCSSWCFKESYCLQLQGHAAQEMKLCPISLYISTDKDTGLGERVVRVSGQWRVQVGTRCTGCWFGGEVKVHLGFSWPYQFLVWRDTLQYGSVRKACCVFWSGGIHCNMVQFIRHAVYSSRLVEYLQNNRLVSSEDCYLDIYFSYTCAMLFNASGQAVWKLNDFRKQDLSIAPYDILTLFSPCLTTILAITSKILIHQLLTLIIKIMHQVQIHEGIFSSWCSQMYHFLQWKSRRPDTMYRNIILSDNCC